MKRAFFHIKLLLLVCILIGTTESAISQCYPASTQTAAGTNPRGIASGDFNADGKLDLVVANLNSSNISVLRGNGAGGFAAAVNTPIGTNKPAAIIAADFNADGKLDIATANSTGNNVSVLLGTGLGTFSAGSNFGTGSAPSDLFAADFNGDSKLDLAVSNRSNNNISILLGNGTGGFGAATNFAVGNQPSGVVAVDYNNDGKLDLAVANYANNRVQLLPGTGTGSFGAITNISLATSTNPTEIIAQDFNGDGKSDLALPNYSSGRVAVLLASGPSFGTPTYFNVGTNPSGVVAADFNGDSKVDLAVSNLNSNNVSLLLGNGLGSFGPTTNYSVAGTTYSLAFGDFNGDSSIDIATANYSTNNISLLASSVPDLPSLAITNPTCASGTGSITVTVQNAGDTYSFNNGASYQASNVRTGLAVGTYTVLIKNTLGCVSTSNSATIAATAATPASPSVAVSVASCVSTMTVTIVSGSDVYSFDNGVSYQAGNIKTGFLPGTYNVITKNSGGCISTASAIVITPIGSVPAPVVNTLTQPICATLTGSVDIQIVDGTDTYSFDNGLTYQVSNSTAGLIPGSYTLVTKNSVGCSSPGTTIVINDAKPTLSVNNTVFNVCDGGSPSILLTNPNNIADTQYVWAVVSSGVSGALSQLTPTTGNSINTSLSLLDNQVTGTVIYSIRAVASGCFSNNQDITVNINPVPDANATSATPVICSGAQVQINLTNLNVNVPGTNFNWTTVATNVTGSSSGSGNSILHTLNSVTGNTSGSVVYSIQPATSYCTGASIPFTILVNPVPTLLATNVFNPCNGTATAIALANPNNVVGTNYAWTSITSGLTGASTSTGSASPIADVLTLAVVNVSGTATYSIQAVANGCSSANQTVVVTARPVPNVSITNPNPAICSGSVTNLTFSNPNNITGTTYSWTTSASNAIGANNGSGTSVAQTLSTTLTNVSGSVTYTVTPAASGCTGIPVLTSITVNPIPLLAVDNSASGICDGAASSITLSNPNSVSGTTYSWLASQTGVSGASSASLTSVNQITDALSLTNPNVSGTVVYSIIASANDCSSLQQNVTITTKPLPTILATNSAGSICSGELTNITISNPNNITGTTFSWSAEPTNATGASGGSGNAISQTLNASTNANGGVGYYITPTANGCAGLPTYTFVTVKPLPTLATNGPSQDVCDFGVTNIVLSNPNSISANYVWSSTQVGLTGASNFGSFGSSGLIDDELILLDSTKEGTATYSIRALAAGCYSPPQQVTVTLRPVPIVGLSAPSVYICSGEALQINLTNEYNLSGVSYNWLASSTNVVGSSNASGSSLNKISQTLSIGSGNSPERIRYTVTASTPYCVSPAPWIEAQINPNPAPPVLPPSVSVCAGVQFISSSSESGLTYNWAPISATNVAGASLGAGTTINQNLSTLDAINPGTVIYRVRNISSAGCASDLSYTVANVYPQPQFTLTNAASNICSGSQTNINFGSGVAGAQIKLKSVNYNGVTGGSLQAGVSSFVSGQSLTETLINATNAPLTVTYTFEATVVGFCGSVLSTKSTSVVVNPNPVFQISNLTSAICSGTATNIRLLSPTAGAVISLTDVNYNGIPGSKAVGDTFANGDSIVETLTNLANGAVTVSYTFRIAASGCSNPITQTTNVTVSPSPSFTSLNGSPSICSDSKVNITLNSSINGTQIRLKSVDYAGISGTLTPGILFNDGQKVTENLVNSSSNPITVNYSFEAIVGACLPSTSKTVSVIVNPNPSFNVANINPLICSGSKTNIDFNSATFGHQINVVSVNYGLVTGGNVIPGSTIYSNGNSIKEALINNTNNSIDVVYTFNVTTPGSVPSCPLLPVSQTATVTVLPAPKFNVSNTSANICSGSQVNLILNSTVAGLQVRLKSINYGAALGTLSAGALFTDGQKITEALLNNTNNPISVDYTFEAIVSSCLPSPEQTVQVTINPNPIFSATNNAATICSGTKTDISFDSPTTSHRINVLSVDYGLVSGGTLNGLSTFTNGTTLKESLINTTNNPIDVVYAFNVTIPNTIPSCPLNPTSQSITVKVLPEQNFTISNAIPIVCSGDQVNITLSSPVKGTQMRLKTVTYGGVVGSLSAGALFTDGQKILEALVNNGDTPLNVNYVFESLIGTCDPSVSQTVTVVVNPKPSFLAANLSPIICSESASVIKLTSPTANGIITLKSVNYNGVNGGQQIAGNTFANGQVISETLVNSSNTPLSISYTFGVSANNCVNATSQTVVVLVNPTPTFAISNSSPGLCSGSSSNITLSTPTANGVVSLVGLSYNGITSGNQIAGNTFTNGQQILETLVNSSNAPLTVNYVFGISANGCINPTSQTTSIVVNPTPSFSLVNNSLEICSGANTDILFGSNTMGHRINVASVNYGAVSGGSVIPNSSFYTNGSTIKEILVNTTNDPIDVVYTFFVTTPNSIPACPLSPTFQSVSVKVLPTPTFTLSNGVTSLCSGSQFTITPNTNAAGTRIKLRSVNYGSVTGSLIGGTLYSDGQKINDLLINNTNDPIVATYLFEAVVGSCAPSSSQSVSVTVNPNPIFNVVNNSPLICSGEKTDIQFISPTSGHQINVSNLNYGLVSGGSITSFTVFNNGTNLKETLTNETNFPVDVVYSFSISTPGASTNCPLLPNVQNVIVRVMPSPAFNINNAASAICSGSQVNITLNSDVNTLQVRLKKINYDGVIGTLIPGLLFTNGQKITEVLNNLTNTPIEVNYEFESIVGSCTSSLTQKAKVIVNPNPSFSITNNAPIICSDGTTNLLFNSNTSGHRIDLVNVNYGLITGGTMVSGASTFTNGTLLKEKLSNNTNNAIDVSYTFSISTPATSPSCPLTQIAQSVTVKVQPTPAFSISNLQPVICTGSQTNVTFNSAVTGVQVKLQSVSYGVISGTLTAGSLFTDGQKLTEALINSTNAPSSVTYVFESVVGNCNLNSSKSISVVVNPVPNFSISNTTPNICSGEATNTTLSTPTVNGLITLVGVTYGNVTGGTQLTGNGFVTGQTISEVLTNPSNVPVLVTYSFAIAANGCNNATVQNTTVIVNPLPTFSVLNASEAICSGSTVSISLVTATSNGVITLSGISYSGATGGTQSLGNTFSNGQKIQEQLVNNGNGPIKVNYTFSVSASGCTNLSTQTTSVIVNPNPAFSISNNALVICSGTQTDIQFTSLTSGHQINVANVSYGLIKGGKVLPQSTTFNNGNLLQEILVNETSSPIDVVYSFNVTTPGTSPSCPISTTNQTTTVRVLPSPAFSVENILAPSICSGGSTDITFHALVEGARIRVKSVDYGLGVGSLTAGSLFNDGQKLTETITNSTNALITVSYLLEGFIGGSCLPSATQTINVVVKPLPVFSISNGTPQMCEGSPNDITLNSPTTNAVVYLSDVNYNGVLGSLTPGKIFTDGQKITEKLVSSFNQSTVVTYSFTAAASGCVNNSVQQTTVSITKKPTLILPADYLVCEPNAISLAGEIGSSASSGIWSIVSGNGVLSPTNISGSTVAASYTPSPFDVGSNISFRLTTNDPDGTGPCVANAGDLRITINRNAKVFAGDDITICANVQSVSIQGAVTHAPNGINWTGGAGGSFSSKVVSTPTYTLASSEINTTQTLVVTALDPDGSGPCLAQTSQMNLKILPLPLVSFTGLPGGNPPALPENNGLITLIGNQQGGVFSISPATSSLGDRVTSPTDKTTFNPAFARIGFNSITYSYTDINNCSNSDTQGVVVDPSTPVDFGALGIITNQAGEIALCADQGLVKLVGNPLVSAGKQPETKFSAAGKLIYFDGQDYYLDTNGAASGNYQVSYTFKNSFNAITTKSRNVKILGSPQAKITVANSCLTDPVKFTDASIVNSTPFPTSIDSWKWDFGDNSGSSLPNPTHIYASSGTKAISLKVTTTQGCSNTVALNTLRVGPKPTADFSWKSVCEKDVTTFEDKTFLTFSAISSYSWDFGDGTKIDQGLAAATHTFKGPGIYPVKLTIATNDGCVSSVNRKVFILPYQVVTPVAPYLEDFEASNARWMADGFEARNSPTKNPRDQDVKYIPSDTSWIWNAPNGNTITALYSKSWWTGKNYSKLGTYFKQENSAVNGPCLNLSALKKPMVSLDYFIDSQKGIDGAVLQYSIDGGVVWTNIGVNNEGINWYNAAGIGSNPGTQLVGNYGWSDNASRKWVNGRFNLDAIPNNSREKVRIRIAFASDEQNPQAVANAFTFDGFAFDNIFVGEKKRKTLVEHFTNQSLTVSLKADDYINSLYDNQVKLTGASDFDFMQYHINFPQVDPLNQDNPTDPAARALFYGISQPPFTLLDGYPDKFNRDVNSVVELDKRSLVDPQFELGLKASLGSSKTKLNLELTIKSMIDFKSPLLVYVVLVENNVGTFRNVVRKQLFGPDGRTINNSWIKNQTNLQTLNDVEIDAPFVDPKNLSIIAFVQDKKSKEVFQSVRVAAPELKPISVTGLDEIALVEEVEIFPNPAKESFAIKTPITLNNRTMFWKVIDDRGLEVISGSFTRSSESMETVNITALSNGVYHVIFNDDGKTFVHRKLVVLK